MGKYHPHGNLAVYDALGALRSPSRCGNPLVDGRATLVQSMATRQQRTGTRKPGSRVWRRRCSKIWIRKRWTSVPNYDGNEIEPGCSTYAHSEFAVNGSDGIAVGMATKIPPHNLTEIVDAAINASD